MFIFQLCQFFGLENNCIKSDILFRFYDFLYQDVDNIECK